ncbi:MAG: hypothetical protein JST49_10840 [Bacteroidetes bacterium]|nr:hypothetical protein [Bacteroidota bacterium]
MKLFRISFLMLFFVLGICAQGTAQDMLEELTRKSCECMNDIDTTADKTAIQMKMGLCMIREAMPYKKELKKKYGIDLDHIDKSVGQALGQLVGARMIIECPEKFEKLVPMVRDQMAERQGKTETKAAEPTKPQVQEQQLEGTITEVKGTEFATIILKDANNREQKLLWLQYFTNAELLTTNLEGLKAGKVTVWYTESEIYNVQLKDYIKYKVITRLEIKQ